jgi:hypothetical protein
VALHALAPRIQGCQFKTVAKRLIELPLGEQRELIQQLSWSPLTGGVERDASWSSTLKLCG